MGWKRGALILPLCLLLAGCGGGATADSMAASSTPGAPSGEFQESLEEQFNQQFS